jgi:VWFA-related protein
MSEARTSRAIHRDISFGMRVVLASATILASGPAVTAWKQSAQAPAEQEHPIHARAGEVSTPAIVRDRHTGEMVLDLTAKDFHVFDNGTPQKIDHVDLGEESLSIVLLVETSSRVEPMLSAIRAAGIVFAEAAMGKTGEAAILGYDDAVTVLEPFTTNSDQVQNAINHLHSGASGIRLYDAMDRGVSLLKRCPVVRRRILMIIGEARDSKSKAKLGAVLRMAELTNVTIYCVGLSTTAANFRQPATQYEPPRIGPIGTYPVPPLKMKPPTPDMEQAAQPNMNLGAVVVWLAETGKNAVGSNSLKLATNATGGLLIDVTQDRAIQNAVDEIGGELHAGYTIDYHLPENKTTGYHEIKITADRPGVTVRTRPGYYIAPPER